MCDKHPGAGCAAPEPQPALASRRRRLWQLGAACHCPLVGVGLPLDSLRKLVGKVCGATALGSDYHVHVGAVSECGSRNRLSDAMQKQFERRYAPVVVRFRAAKCSLQVVQLWRAAMAEGNVAGAFWAGLTHPRCTPELEETMCHDLHMIQHQAGACVRADINKFNGLQDENARLNRELARLQQRGATLLEEKCAESERHDALLMQARAQAIGKDSVIDSLRAGLAQLQASIPGLESRTGLVRRLSQMEQRERGLRNQITELKQALQRMPEPPPLPALMPEPARPMTMPIRLAERSVLCVGGRSGNVATYRNLIETVGAQFAHHDGGVEDSAKLLDSSLAAADFVICQTGCISHNAYWRVKDHCKRTGKRCLFVDNPSISSLERSLREAGRPELEAAPRS